jgi:hypothetical protein
MAECMLHKLMREELEKIQLSNNTVHCHIQDLSDDMEHQLMPWLKSYNGASLQIDGSTDVSELVVLHVCM